MLRFVELDQRSASLPDTQGVDHEVLGNAPEIARRVLQALSLTSAQCPDKDILHQVCGRIWPRLPIEEALQSGLLFAVRLVERAFARRYQRRRQSGSRHIGTEAGMIPAARQGSCRLRLESGLRRPHVAVTDRRSIGTGVLYAWRTCDPGSLCQLLMLP